MFHEKEVKYWADHPDGTLVWEKEPDRDWERREHPRWFDDCIYIVDDEWAELRKAQADGKQLQAFTGNEWVDKTLDLDIMRILYIPMAWRIKTDKIKKYKWAYTCNCDIYITKAHYATVEELLDDIGCVSGSIRIEETCIEEDV